MARKRKGKMRLTDETVPFKMNEPIYELLNYIFFIYGPPKIGKTTVACSWPKPMVFACETRGIAVKKVMTAKIRNWSQFRGSITKFSKKKYRNKYQTIVIDTVSLAFKYCLDWCCETYGFEHPSDEGWGKGWEKLNNEFLEQILRLFDTGKSIIFVAHSIDKEVKGDWGSTTKTEAQLPGPARKILLPIVDVILYMKSKKKGKRRQRMVTTKTTPRYEAGDRTGCLTDKTIFIPRKHENDAYEIINGIFVKNAEKL